MKELQKNTLQLIEGYFKGPEKEKRAKEATLELQKLIPQIIDSAQKNSGNADIREFDSKLPLETRILFINRELKEKGFTVTHRIEWASSGGVTDPSEQICHFYIRKD